MKGFIELTLVDNNNTSVLVNVNKITEIGNYVNGVHITFSQDYYFKVKEPYEKVKELIKQSI